MGMDNDKYIRTIQELEKVGSKWWPKEVKEELKEELHEELEDLKEHGHRKEPGKDKEA